MMRRRAWIAVLMWGVSAVLQAQFTDPHTYDNSPVDVNQIEVAFAYARSDTSVDVSQVIQGASLGVHQETLTYTRYLGMAGRTGWVQASLPMAQVNGEVKGTSLRGSLDGTADSAYQVAVLLKGGPAMHAAEFETFHPVATWGASLTVTAPTGQYDPGRILSLGTHRWSFKPELAYSLPFGSNQRWELDTYANVYFFTSNVTYNRVQMLQQSPLGGLEGHLSYSFNESVWLSVDARYSFRGETAVDGVRQNDSQKNVVLGSELCVNLNAKNALIFGLGSAPLHVNGPSARGITVKYDYSWGGG